MFRHTLFSVIACLVLQSYVLSAESEVESSVQDILSHFKAKQITFYDARDQLKQLPKGEVIIALCQTIQDGGIDDNYNWTFAI